MAFQDEYPDLATAVTDLFDAAGSIKQSLAAGSLNVDAIVNAIPDQQDKADVERLLNGLKKLPPEFAALMSNPWKLMTEFAPFLMNAASAVFK